MHPDPILVIGSFEVRLYGLFLAIGLIACAIVYYIYTKKKNMPTAVQDFSFVVMFIAIVVGFLFAYLFQAVYGWIETGVFKFGGITACIPMKKGNTIEQSPIAASAVALDIVASKDLSLLFLVDKFTSAECEV